METIALEILKNLYQDKKPKNFREVVETYKKITSLLGE